MADTKISALTNKATLDGTEFVPIVHDPSGTPTTQRTTAQAIVDLVTAPTRTTTTLSGSSTDVSIPAGCTRIRLVSAVITLSSSTSASAIGLRHTGNTVDQAWTGVEYASGGVMTVTVLTSGAAFASSGNGGTTRYLHAEITGPLDATKKTMAISRGTATTGDVQRDRTVIADAAENDGTIRFFVAGGGTQSGTVEIEWFYN